MLDHVGVNVSDIERAKAFYSAALAPIGYKVLADFGPAAGLGSDRPDFWIAAGAASVTPVHIAFRGEDRATVDAFHAAALAAGGSDNGAPGLRPQYHPDYYGAFVLDADGNNVEVVCHAPS